MRSPYDCRPFLGYGNLKWGKAFRHKLEVEKQRFLASYSTLTLTAHLPFPLHNSLLPPFSNPPLTSSVLHHSLRSLSFVSHSIIHAVILPLLAPYFGMLGSNWGQAPLAS